MARRSKRLKIVKHELNPDKKAIWRENRECFKIALYAKREKRSIGKDEQEKKAFYRNPMGAIRELNHVVLEKLRKFYTRFIRRENIRFKQRQTLQDYS